METKENKKITKTQRKIFDFLTNFLQEHEEKEVSINLICKETNTSRNTFYYHYSNLEELYIDYLNYYKTKFIEKTNDQNSDKIKQYYTLYKSEFNIVKAYLKMTNYSLEKHVEFKKNFFLPYILQDEKKYNNLTELEKLYIAGGIITVEYYWAKEGFKEPIDVMVEKIKEMIYNQAKKIQNKQYRKEKL